MRNKLLKLAETGILLPSQIIIGYLALMCLLFHTFIQFGNYAIYSYEFAVISKNSLIRILFILFGFLAFACLKSHLKDVSPKKLFLNFLYMYCFCAIFLILQSSSVLKDDANLILQSAREISQGDYRAFLPVNFSYYGNQGGYLFYNPHQLGLVFLEQILINISDNPRFFFFLNFLIVLWTNYMVYRLVDLISNHNKTECNYAIILSFLFCPQLFFILFVYGILVCNLLIISAYYYFIKFIKQGQKCYLVYHLLLVAFAVFIKNNAMIALIAFCILFVLEFIKSNKKIMLFAPVLAIALSFSSSFLLKQYYEQKIGEDIPDGMPMSSYLMMGLSNYDLTARLGGWWNRYNMNIYQNNDYDTEKTLAAIKVDFANRMKEMAQHPLDTYKFFTQKIISTWTDPMFQSIWSGPMQKNSQFNGDNPVIQDLGFAGPIYHLFDFAENILVFIIYFCLALFLYKNKQINRLWLFTYLYFLGGFLFHFAWETKSQYVMNYVFVMIPLCAHFLSTSNADKYSESILNSVSSFISKIKEKLWAIKPRNSIIYAILIVLQMGICVYFGSQKQSFYCDEPWSYGLANNENYAFLDKQAAARVSENGWVTREFYDNFVTIDRSRPFSFSAAYHNQEIDVHPPFYYFLLRIASLFTDHLSKWPGIILNLVILLLFDFVFFYIAKSIFKDNIKPIIALALFSASPAGLSSILYIRMYFLLTFLVMCYLALHVRIIKNKRISYKDLMLLFVCMVCGGLTHYYFYLFAFFISAAYGISLLWKKEIYIAFLYGSVLLGGFLFNINFFPATAIHVFLKDRGVEVLEKINNNGIFWTRQYITWINNYMYAGYFFAFMAALIFVAVYKVIITRNVVSKIVGVIKEGACFKENNVLISLLIYVLLTTTIIITGISWCVHRFAYPSYAFLAIVTVFLLNVMYKGVGIKNKFRDLISIFIVALFIILGLQKQNIDFRYPDYPAAVAALESTNGYDALVYYSKPLAEEYYTSLPLKFRYDETYVFDEEDLPNLGEIVERRKTKDTLMIITPLGHNKEREMLKEIKDAIGASGAYNLIHTYRGVHFFEIK